MTFLGTLDEVQKFFIRNNWTDGLPIIPPTEERVQEMLRGTSHAPDEVMGLLNPEFWQATVEKVAVNAVMAGCKPEYLPVVLAAVSAAIEKDPTSRITSATSNVPMYLINGPIRNEIRMNKGLGAMARAIRPMPRSAAPSCCALSTWAAGGRVEIAWAPRGIPASTPSVFPKTRK